MLAQLEKRVALAAVEFFEIEHVLIEGHCLFDIIDLNGNVVTAIDLHAHNQGIGSGGPGAFILPPKGRFFAF